MATERELEILAREALHLIEREGVPEGMAKQSVLNAHKDIRRTDGIMRAIGEKMTAIRKTHKEPPKSKVFVTHIEKSLRDD